jgi:two-component system KDP operon response regulator KdpE
MAERPPDALVFDLDLTDIDGKQLLTQVRSSFEGPILILSACKRELEKIEAFDLGADDFVNKPFTISEVLARLRVAFRRRILAAGILPMVHSGELSIDLAARTATRGNSFLVLTEYQYALLAKLAAAGGRLLTYSSLFEGGAEEGGIRTLSTLRFFIQQLRVKIEVDPKDPVAITTVRGIGYRLNVTPQSSACT